MLSRRSFLKALMGLAGLSLVPEGRTEGSWSARPADPRNAWQVEEYAGFLLLAQGTPVPDFVVYPPWDEHAVTWLQFASPSELARFGGFRLYVPAAVPPSLRYAGCMLASGRQGVPIGACVLYRTPDDSPIQGATKLTVEAVRPFPVPFPLWSSEPVEPGGPAAVLEKVSFLPSPGIMVATADGYAFHWIRHGVLYTLLAEYGPSRSEATALAERLIPVG